MAKIYLTSEIDNWEEGIDKTVAEINAVPSGERLELWVTCPGGFIADGARIHDALSRHDGETVFIGIGLVASYAALLMASCDTVEFEADVDIMLHVAQPPWWVSEKDLTKGDYDRLRKFNDMAYDRLLNKGVNKDFLNKVFKPPYEGDHWLTASEAVDLKFGTSFTIVRKDNKPYKVVEGKPDELLSKAPNSNQAFMNKAQSKENYYSSVRGQSAIKMVAVAQQYKPKLFNMFKKSKAMQEVHLADGGRAVFLSNSATPVKGDQLARLGPGPQLKGSVKLQNRTDIILNEIGEVVDVVVPEITNKGDANMIVTTEDFDALKARVDALEASLKEVKKSMPGDAKPDSKPDSKPDAKATPIRPAMQSTGRPRP